MSEPEVSDLITVEEAMAILDGVAVRPRVIDVPLLEAAGLYLARELRGDRDAPPFDKSLMDGYAVRAADLVQTPRELLLIGHLAAGGVAKVHVETGTALAIMTGAPLPPGADAVVPIEQTQRVDSTLIRFLQPAAPGAFIARRGSDMGGGEVVLQAGARMDAPQIAVAASIGAARLSVFAPPVVGVLGTGDELVLADQTPTGSQIRSSNNPMLLTLLKRFPCRATDLQIVRDDPALIRQAIQAGLQHDLLLITGGMSMGERDYVPGLLRELGGNLRITQLRIKPGKPFIFAEMPGGKFAFGLPGNPVSAFVCSVVLVSRVLRKIAGAVPAPKRRFALLASDIEGNGKRAFYQPAIFDGRSLTPLAWKGSADIFTLARANALMVRAENQKPQAAGTAVEFIEL